MVSCSCKLNSLTPYDRKDGTRTVSASLTFKNKDAENWIEVYKEIYKMLENIVEEENLKKNLAILFE